jgi:hypothetical protein
MYYMASQRKSETPREFYYRLIRSANRADIDFTSSKKLRDRHIKVFIKKLTDSRLRTTLQGQRIRRLEDLEFILKQHEDLRNDTGSETPPPRGRDFRADNQSGSRFRPKPSGRAYYASDVEEPDGDEGKQVRFEETDEVITPTAPPAQPVVSTPTPTAASGGTSDSVSWKSELPEEVYRVLADSGWTPPLGHRRPDGQGPHFGFSKQTRHCDNCGEGSHSTEYCWADIVCDRCHLKGHPARKCTSKPCPFCNQLYDGKCDAVKLLQALRGLGRQGLLKDVVPDHLLKQLLDGDTDSGKQSSN